MDVQTRRKNALELIHQRGEVTVAELSAQTGVSPMTIRRDLELLEQEGAVRRVHGGAIDLASRGYGAPYAVRSRQSIEAKARIGKAVASMLGERETIILDVGTTTLQVAHALAGRRNLTVITTSLQIADVLSRNRDIRLMITGGIVSPGELSLVGDMAEEAFDRLRLDTYVMGVGGVDAEAGVTEFSLEDARVKRAALASVQRCIVAADGSKLGKVTFAQVCPIERVDVVVTDDSAAPEDVEALTTRNIEVVVV